jgi:hypothetical protein
MSNEEWKMRNEGQSDEYNTADMQEAAKAVRELSLEMKESVREPGREPDFRFGELPDYLVPPSISEKFNALGYHFSIVMPGGMRIYKPDGQILAEIDLLLESTETMMAVTIQEHLGEKDVDEHIERLEVLRAWADKHRGGRKILGAIMAPAAAVPQAVRQHALNAGQYVIVPSGETVKIDVPEGFVPRQW